MSILAHKKLFKATFVALNDVEYYQDLPIGNGVVDMEERQNDMYSLNYIELKEEQDYKTVEERASSIAKKVIETLTEEATSATPAPKASHDD